jgi:hypothetical protein
MWPEFGKFRAFAFAAVSSQRDRRIVNFEMHCPKLNVASATPGQLDYGTIETQTSQQRMNESRENLIRELSAPLREATGWMRFLGVIAILYGIALALTIIGLIIAWIPIWIGILLFQSAGAAERAERQAEQESLILSLSKLRLCFAVLGGLAILGLIIFTVFLVAYLTGSALAGGGQT